MVFEDTSGGIDIEALWAAVQQEVASPHSAFVFAKISRKDPSNCAVMAFIANSKDPDERDAAKSRLLEMGVPPFALRWKEDAKSTYSHRDPLGRGGQAPPCIYFAQGRCKKGADCKFSHDTPPAAAGGAGGGGRGRQGGYGAGR
jgi:hypothetical protein